jgi:hypothetical protein
VARTAEIAREASRSSSSGDGLEGIVEIERRIDEMLGEANRESGRLIEAARLAWRDAAERAEVEIADAARELRARSETERRRRIAEIAAAAAVEASAFDAIGADRVAEIAAYVVSRLLARQTGGSG